MGYKAAAQVLPEDLLLAVQEYIDGESVQPHNFGV